MQELAHISIELCLFPEEEVIAESQLHIFGDAAEEAYANVEDVPTHGLLKLEDGSLRQILCRLPFFFVTLMNRASKMS
jgi:hypothetical protein